MKATVINPLSSSLLLSASWLTYIRMYIIIHYNSLVHWIQTSSYSTVNIHFDTLNFTDEINIAWMGSHVPFTWLLYHQFKKPTSMVIVYFLSLIAVTTTPTSVYFSIFYTHNTHGNTCVFDHRLSKKQISYCVFLLMK